MSYAVDSGRRMIRGVILAGGSRSGPKSKEFAPASPMKRSRTGRVCAFRMKAPIKRRSLHRFTPRGRLAIANSPRNGLPSFYLLNRCSQPHGNLLFNFGLVAVTIERVQRVTCRIQWNVPAGDSCGAHLRRYQMHQNAIPARGAILPSVVVHTSGRILENIKRPPRRLWRTPVTSVFKEFEFKFKDLQEVPLVCFHFAPPTQSKI
jgi:hypothetical protein